METQQQKQYVLQDIMKKRRKDKQALQNKLKNKLSIKGKKKKNADALKNPEKFIKQYRAAQKSYAYLKNKNKQISKMKINKKNVQSFGKLILAIRLRGVKDISDRQKIILNKLGLKSVNSAVFIKGTITNLKQLKKIQNYVTYGQPSLKTVKQLIFKKMYGKIGNERVQINSNQLVEKHIGGDVICLEDIVNQVYNLGSNFKKINQFIFPFKLTTPDQTLMSRLRKPIEDGGHWGYRGRQIDSYVMNMV